MLTNKQVVDNALKTFWEGRANWTYLLGSTGLVVGVDSKVKNYFEYFQSHGRISKDFTYAQWFEKHKGQQTGDCSNTVLNYLVYGNQTKGCNSCWSSSAPQKWEQVERSNLMGGEVAWKNGHVGLVIQVNPVITLDIPGPSSLEASTFRQLNLNENPNYWTGFAKFPTRYVNYTEIISGGGSDLYITKVEASLRAGLQAGYTLTAGDFTVKVYYNTGKVVTNPTGWASINRTTSTPTIASLKLASGTNRIYVIYQGVYTEFDYVCPGGAKNYTVTFTESDLKALKTLCPNVTAKEV